MFGIIISLLSTVGLITLAAYGFYCTVTFKQPFSHRCSNGFEGCTHDNLTDEDIYQMLTLNSRDIATNALAGASTIISNNENHMTRDCFKWFWDNSPPDIERHKAYIAAMMELDDVETAAIGHTVTPMDIEQTVADIITDAKVRDKVVVSGSSTTRPKISLEKLCHTCVEPNCGRSLHADFSNVVAEYTEAVEQALRDDLIIHEFGNPEPILLSSERWLPSEQEVADLVSVPVKSKKDKGRKTNSWNNFHGHYNHY